MSPMHQPLDKASGQQARGRSRVTRCLRLLLLAGLWLYLPLEAFDAEADVGLDEAVLQDFGALCASPSGSTLVPDSSAGSPTWCTLRPVTLATAVPLSRASGDPVNRQLWHLRASRLCARSRIAELPCPLQQQVRTRNLVVSSRSFTNLLAVEGGFFYEEVRGHKTNADRSNDSERRSRPAGQVGTSGNRVIQSPKTISERMGMR